MRRIRTAGGRAFARYRIKNARRFNQESARSGRHIQLTTRLTHRWRPVLAKSPSYTVCATSVGLDRRIREQLDKEADGYGIEVVRCADPACDLPRAEHPVVYQHADRAAARGAEFRARRSEAQEIRSTPTEATSSSPKPIDAREQVARRRRRTQPAFAEAYGKDRFLRVYRSNGGYENGLKSNDTAFLLRRRLRLLQVSATRRASRLWRLRCRRRFGPRRSRKARTAHTLGRAQARLYVLGFMASQTPERGRGFASRCQSKKNIKREVQSDEVHSVRRLPHRFGHSVCA